MSRTVREESNALWEARQFLKANPAINSSYAYKVVEGMVTEVDRMQVTLNSLTIEFLRLKNMPSEMRTQELSDLNYCTLLSYSVVVPHTDLVSVPRTMHTSYLAHTYKKSLRIALDELEASVHE